MSTIDEVRAAEKKVKEFWRHSKRPVGKIRPTLELR
jgi:hypothetical protein